MSQEFYTLPTRPLPHLRGGGGHVIIQHNGKHYWGSVEWYIALCREECPRNLGCLAEGNLDEVDPRFFRMWKQPTPPAPSP